MNLTLLSVLLVAGVAVAVVVLAWRYLKWQAVLWLGVLFTGTAGIALLLDHLNEIVEIGQVGQRTATGIPLFMIGPEISILGMGWPFFFVAFLCGIALIVTSLVKKATQPKQVVDSPEPVEEKTSEVSYIEQELKNEIDNVGIDDPEKRGESDATQVGGPIPKHKATVPEGYELEARNAYEALGDSFVRRVVERLKEDIAVALQALKTITDEIGKQPYIQVADGHYSEHAATITDQQVDSMRTAVSETEQQHSAFVKKLKLKPSEQPDWPAKRTSLTQLLLLGGIFALIEFIVSWYFLKDQLGGSAAVKVAGLAVVVIVILAFGSAAIFQFTRRGQSIPIRILASAGYAFLLFLAFCSFGLLLDFRDALAVEGIAGQFDVVLDGYGSMLTKLDNLTLFLINLFALAFFYWKALLFFDRFHGYRSVKDPYDASVMAWDNMFEDNDASIRDALNFTSDKADEDSNVADNAFSSLQEKKTVLENIQSIITPMFIQHLHRAYRDDIKVYRDSNRERRNHKVYPSPEHFTRDAEFCGVGDHFADGFGIAKFLQQHENPIDAAGDASQNIQQANLAWQNERPKLSEKWAREFKRRIRDSGE